LHPSVCTSAIVVEQFWDREHAYIEAYWDAALDSRTQWTKFRDSCRGAGKLALSQTGDDVGSGSKHEDDANLD